LQVERAEQAAVETAASMLVLELQEQLTQVLVAVAAVEIHLSVMVAMVVLVL
jgi:hypothetical protein